jgi:anti-anti-sigma factor
MSFNATSVASGGVTVITLEGELDSISAPLFRSEVQRVTELEPVERLFLDMTALTYLSSAGLRGLVFARQKMRDDVDLVLVGVSGAVEQTIRMVGFHHSVAFSDVLPVDVVSEAS